MVIVLKNRLEESISFLMLMTSYHIKNNMHFNEPNFYRPNP